MKRIEYISINKAPQAVLKRLRKMGEEKAQRLQKIQERWECGGYNDVEVVQL